MEFDGQALRIVRRACQIPQAELAVNIGVNPAMISHLENGFRDMNRDLKAKIREALPVTDAEIAALISVHKRLEDVKVAD